jgi:DNA-binding NtrC family response regulator
MSAKSLIVCVDDDASVLTAVARSLRRDDLEIRTTESPSDALAWIANDDVAVLVSDYDMPGMTGAQLAGHARLLKPTVVRILLTGQQNIETAIDGINQGEVFRFISKPFDRDHLRKSVDAALERHRELVELSGDRERRQRRERLRAALDGEYRGITQVARDADGRYSVEDPRRIATELGWTAVAKALDD